MNRPIKNRKTFFECLHEGLQRYFDSHDKRFDGVLYITVGVKQGHVGGIIKSDDPFPFAPKEYIGDRLYYEKRVRRREGAAPSNSSQARLLGADKSAVVATDAPFASAPQGGGLGPRRKGSQEKGA